MFATEKCVIIEMKFHYRFYAQIVTFNGTFTDDETTKPKKERLNCMSNHTISTFNFCKTISNVALGYWFVSITNILQLPKLYLIEWWSSVIILQKCWICPDKSVRKLLVQSALRLRVWMALISKSYILNSMQILQRIVGALQEQIFNYQLLIKSLRRNVECFRNKP